jgi:hypothetical protein
MHARVPYVRYPTLVLSTIYSLSSRLQLYKYESQRLQRLRGIDNIENGPLAECRCKCGQSSSKFPILQLPALRRQFFRYVYLHLHNA